MKLAPIDPRDRYDKIMEYVVSGWAMDGVNHAVPNIAGLAAYLGVGKAVIKAWCENDEDIAGLVEAMQAKQEAMLISYGLRKAFDAKVVSLMLAKHGYSTQSTIEHIGIPKPATSIAISNDPQEAADAYHRLMNG
jgi:hypothetical protein